MSDYTTRFLLFQFLYVYHFTSHHFPEQTPPVYISGAGGGAGRGLGSVAKEFFKMEEVGIPTASFEGRELTLQIPRFSFRYPLSLFLFVALPAPPPLITNKVGGGHCPGAVCGWLEKFPASPPSLPLGPSRPRRGKD